MIEGAQEPGELIPARFRIPAGTARRCGDGTRDDGIDGL